MTFTERYTSFSPEQLLDVHLSIRDVEAGQYMVTETVINRASGSAFDQWVAMGAVELRDTRNWESLPLAPFPPLINTPHPLRIAFSA